MYILLLNYFSYYFQSVLARGWSQIWTSTFPVYGPAWNHHTQFRGWPYRKSGEGEAGEDLPRQTLTAIRRVQLRSQAAEVQFW